MRCASPLIRFVLLICIPGLSPVALAQPAPQDDPPPSPVKVSPVIEREIESSRTVVGTVQPARRSVVGSAVDGRVVSFPVENGDRVAAGDTLAQLRTDALQWQLSAAKAEQRLRTEELAELTNGTDPETIANLQALMKAAESQRDHAQSQFTRIEKLFQRGQVVTQTQLDDARSQASSALQEYVAAKSLYDLAVRGPRQEKIAQAEARLEMQKAIVHELEDRIARHTVVAPFDGFVVAEHTEVGQWAASGDPIAEVVQLSEVDVRTNVLEEQVASLHIGQQVQVVVPAVPEEQWPGTVHRIIPQADVRSRTFPVDIRITNRIVQGVPVLKSGFLASVRLPTGGTRRSLLVPKDALVLGGRQTVVYVVDPLPQGRDAGLVRPVPVTTGLSEGGAIEVRGELTIGDRVVVEGNERLERGDRVRILTEADDE